MKYYKITNNVGDMTHLVTLKNGFTMCLPRLSKYSTSSSTSYCAITRNVFHYWKKKLEADNPQIMSDNETCYTVLCRDYII